MADWLGIDGSNLDSFCGEELAYRLINALYGTDYWQHLVDESPHWFVLDLGQRYSIEKVRGRSKTSRDPVTVNIYVSDDNVNWGSAVASGIDTFQDSDAWQEVDVTVKNGRFVLVQIMATETPDHYLHFGKVGGITIFDVYGGPPAGGRSHRTGIRGIQGAERLRGIRSNAPY